MNRNILFKICFTLFVCIVISPSLVYSSEKTKGSESSAAFSLIKIKNGRITADIKDMKISEVLKEISRKAKIEFTIDEGIEEKINIKFACATIEEALKILCENRAIVFEYQPEKQAYRIVSVGTYSGQKEKKSEKKKFNTYKQQQKQKISGQLFVSEMEKNGAESITKNSEKIYDDRGRLLYKPGELLVKFKEGSTEKQIADLHKTVGSTVLRRIDSHRLQQIKLREDLSEAKAVLLYQASGLVEIAEKHALRYANATIPNDEYFSEQWGLARICAPEAWDFTTGSPEVIIAVIDTGVDYLHPDLADNIWINSGEISGNGLDDDNNGYVDDVYGWDFAGNDETDCYDADTDPMDVDNHGTHVAGIIAAEGNNNIGIAGVCWNAKIMVLKVQADNGEYMEDVDVIEAINYAINNDAKIVNCSFGGGAFAQIEYDAFASLKNAGILAVCAAGNDGINTDVAGNENYPSCYDLDNIISVAASDSDDRLANISNYGSTSVDVMAPGYGIKSTVPAYFYTAASVKINGETYTAYGMTFAGITDKGGITGILYKCGKGYPDEFPAGVSDNITLIERGNNEGAEDFFFSEKATNAQVAGAKAIIIYNNVTGEFDNWTLGASGDWPPVVCISREDGLLMKEMDALETTVINHFTNVSSCYKNESGTSMAAPHVSGIIGLMLSQNPFLDYTVVKSSILDSVDKISDVSDKMVSGGRVHTLNAFCSVNTLPGDLSRNGLIELDDVIFALQVVSGFNPAICPVYISSGVDPTGDGRIGLADAIYIMQKVSELFQ